MSNDPPDSQRRLSQSTSRSSESFSHRLSRASTRLSDEATLAGSRRGSRSKDDRKQSIGGRSLRSASDAFHHFPHEKRRFTSISPEGLGDSEPLVPPKPEPELQGECLCQLARVGGCRPSIEEVLYWAQLERQQDLMQLKAEAAAQRQRPAQMGSTQRFYRMLIRKPRRMSQMANPVEPQEGSQEADTEDLASLPELSRTSTSTLVDSLFPRDEKETVSHPTTPREKLDAYRSLKTATTLSIFYLITSDVIRFTLAPRAYTKLGYLPPTLLFIFCAAVTTYTGVLLWRMYMKLDSSRYPIKTYSDLGERIFGPRVKLFMNCLQSFQLLVQVALSIEVNGGFGLSQIVKNRYCYIGLMGFYCLAGVSLGQIRAITQLGGMARIAVYLSLLGIFFTMGVVAHSGISLVAAYAGGNIPIGTAPPPVLHVAVEGNPFFIVTTTAYLCVYAFSGGMLFIELLAEMRRPWDFWKAMLASQLVALSSYLLYGIFIYAFQGQFSNQGISPYVWQTILNVNDLITALIPTALYTNIAIKIFYANVFEKFLGLPHMMSKKGRYLWGVTVVLYWAAAWTIAAAVSQYQYPSSLVAAIGILQFSYTFPPLLYLGFKMHEDAISGDKPFDPSYKESHRVDTWRDWSRWKRALRRDKGIKLFHLLFFIICAGAAVLGIWVSVLAIKEGFIGSQAPPFSCNSPVAYYGRQF